MDYDIRLISLSGFAGESPVKNAGLEQVVQAAAENLQSAPGKDTVIMGHSLGGFVALKLGLDSAVPLSELIIIDSLPYLSGMMMPGADPEQAAQMAASMAERMKVMPRAQFDAQQAMGLPRLVKDQNYIPLLKEWGQASDQKTVSDYMAALLTADSRDSLSGLDIPLTVLAAYDASMGVSKERITSIYESQYSKAKFIDLIVVEDSYHFIMWDQAERFAAIVKSALSNQ
jgi:pimeloyl-ACP methyl ester carboxylesterase